MRKMRQLFPFQDFPGQSPLLISSKAVMRLTGLPLDAQDNMDVDQLIKARMILFVQLREENISNLF